MTTQTKIRWISKRDGRLISETSDGERSQRLWVASDKFEYRIHPAYAKMITAADLSRVGLVSVPDDVLGKTCRIVVSPPSPTERADNADRQAETEYSHSDGAHSPDDYDG